MNNVVAVGHPEPAVAALDPASFDLESVQQWIANIGGNPDHSTEVFRMGKPGRMPRPLKIKLNDKNTKALLLRRQKDISTAKGFFIRHDMTAKQREADRNLRADLAQKRSDNPGKAFVIRNGVIIEVTGGQQQQRQNRGGPSRIHQGNE